MLAVPVRVVLGVLTLVTGSGVAADFICFATFGGVIKLDFLRVVGFGGPSLLLDFCLLLNIDSPSGYSPSY